MMLPEVKSLFPPSAIGADSLSVASEPLFPEEETYVARAVDKRRREFAWGRSCARRALAELGVVAEALVPLADRSVPWPVGCIGSITHADGYVAAVVAKTADLRGLGIDAECRGRLGEHLWKQIANEQERAWFCSAASETERTLRATLTFSAKEAFYKAQYCLSRAWVGFHDVTLQASDGRFSIVLCKDIAGLAPKNTRYEGRYALTEAHVISAMWIA
jgi:4'-phosphopantetheinyl transferase EntD